MSKPGKRLSFLLLALMLMIPSFATARANPANRVSEFKLANGLVLVVVPDNRAPVVTHMVYYPRRRRRRAAWRIGHRPFPRALDVQVDGEARHRRVLRHRLAPRRPAQRLHQLRLHRLLPARLQGPSEDDHGDGSRPDGEPAAEREGGRDRAPGHHRGAPRAHRERALEHPGRADVGGAVPEPSLPHPHHRLDARDGEAVARGRADLLQALLRAQQRHRGGHGRRQSGRGQGAGRGHLRHAAGQPERRRSHAAAGARAARPAPRGAQGSARRQRFDPALLLGPGLSQGGARRGRGALPAHEDRRRRRHQPALSEAGGGGEGRLQRRRLVLRPQPRQRLHRPVCGGGRGRLARQGGAGHGPGGARAARERRHRGRAGACQAAVHRRVRLRVGQSGDAGPTLRRGAGARDDDREDQQLADCDRQGHAGGREAGGGQVLRYSPLGHGQLDPCHLPDPRARAPARPPSRPCPTSPEGSL